MNWASAVVNEVAGEQSTLLTPLTGWQINKISEIINLYGITHFGYSSIEQVYI